MASLRKWNADVIADEVAYALQLEQDLVIQEIRTAESRREALKRLRQLKEDVDLALEIVLRAKGGG